MNIEIFIRVKGDIKLEEENFEKKSSKKTLKIVLLVLLILAIAGAVTFFAFNKVNSKPEKIFDKAVNQMFKESDKIKEYKTASVELDISAEVKTIGNNLNPETATQIKMISAILKDANLHTEIQVDLEKKLFDWVIVAQYENKDVINLEAIIQDEKVYFYLKDLYEKYIEVPTEYLEDIDLGSIFQTSKVDEKLAKDVEKILKSKIENSELETEEVEIEVLGKDKKVNKSSMKLSVKELEDVCYDILDKVNEYQEDIEIKEAIADMQEVLKDSEETENYMNIDIYSEKTGNNIVRVDIALVNKEDDEVILIRAVKTDDKTWEIVFSINEDSTDVKDVTDMIKIVLKEENENEGKISFTVMFEEEGMEATLNVKYKVEYNKDIEKKNIKESISAEDMTEADLMEIYENAQKNEILKSIIDMGVSTYNSVNSNKPTYNNVY
jgi:hypothetical protein